MTSKALVRTAAWEGGERSYEGLSGWVASDPCVSENVAQQSFETDTAGKIAKRPPPRVLDEIADPIMAYAGADSPSKNLYHSSGAIGQIPTLNELAKRGQKLGIEFRRL